MGDVRELFPNGPPYDGYTCACGSTWFELEVLLDARRRVSGWGEYASCQECGTRIKIEGWTHEHD